MVRQIAAGILGVIILAGVALAQDPGQPIIAAVQPRTITVSGNSKVYVTPDEAILMIGVNEQGAKLAEVKASADTAGKAILAAIRKLGSEEKDIQTDNLQVYMTQEPGRPEKSGPWFVVNRAYRVKLRNAEKVQPLYDAVVAAGANSVSGPVYQTSELRKYRDEARAMALTAAKEKATAMAKELNAEIGPVRTIREASERSFMPMYAANSFAAAPGQMVAQGGAAAAGDDSTPLGQIEVSADVEVVFDLMVK